ncbi:MAG: pyruvate dehydrogenase [Chloroflexi bacterium]|jgi:pyruvate dehydrogenase E1 component|nr:pyruvate dehydrogenase [Chloroflexota bacterium]MBT4514556.1 pyruvate dehydrogenase [Chloroflexota bacterium]MBT5319192.1 pyruvate dehydrogenase [Chloroflexota bacterium]
MVAVNQPGRSQVQLIRDNARDRVLWLATAIIHWANNVRESTDGSKVGGHQASSASSAAILTALYFETLTSEDRVAIKPHASPVYHAIQYLLGNLDVKYLPTLREFGGLQAYPSRTKDPDRPDFSSGSVGLSPGAVTFGALVRDYLDGHGLEPTSGRFFAHMGDAELDEGSIWETVTEPAIQGLDRCTWIVDLNRQSLDRVVPGIRVARFMEMFRVNGWNVVVAKYGEQLTELMELPGGEALRSRIDDMPNQEYQAMLVASPSEVRARLLETTRAQRGDIERCVSDFDDEELHRRIAGLGGHDVGTLARCYEEASRADGPSVVFAYTVKGWGLPIAADPANHSALVTQEQYEELADHFGVAPDFPWDKFPDGSDESIYLSQAAQRLNATPIPEEPPLSFNDTDLGITSAASTQESFARILLEIGRTSPDAAERIVTVSPDVATSTSLGSWINRTGVWHHSDATDFFDTETRTLRWTEGPTGRHIELGLSETSLFLLLGQLGLSKELSGRRLVPIGTLYDPFIVRGLDPLVYGVYQESKFIAVATPSGVTLSPEGGSHQGMLSPSIGMELPNIRYYEPTFARELEWILLESIRGIGSGEGESVFLRLSTKVVDQSLFNDPRDEAGIDALREAVLGGCYRLRTADSDADTIVNLFATGVMVPEAVAAIPLLEKEGIGVNVFSVTSPDMLHRRIRTAEQEQIKAQDSGPYDPSGLLAPHEIGSPVVTVIDGSPHTLAFIGSALDSPSINLGVDTFGQSGSRQDLYGLFGIDTEGIYAAALGVVDRERRRRTQG